MATVHSPVVATTIAPCGTGPLNVDYRIAARALSHRLKRVINTIVSVDQSGFMKGRSATENVRLIQDIIDYIPSMNIHEYSK